MGQSHKAVKNSATIFEKGPKWTMKRDIIEHLRRFSSVPGKEKTWVSELNDARLFELYLKIRNGESARSIARHAQTVWRVARKSSIHSISQGILKFKQRISHLLLFPSSTNEETNDSVLPHGCEEDSTLETMENIARNYEGRIKRMLVEEKETGVKFPFLNRDMSALASLRKTLLREKEWAATHEDPLKQKKRERMEKSIDRRFNALMENIGEDGQERLAMAINRFLELAEEKTLTVYRKEDGTYTLVNPEEKPRESTSK